MRSAPSAPDGWTVYLLREVAERVTTRNTVGNTNVLTVSAIDGLVGQTTYFQRRVASSDLSPYYLLRPGDFVYSKSYSEGYPVGAIRRLKGAEPGVVSPLYICFRTNSAFIDKKFFEYYFDSGALNDEINWIAKEGARNHGLLNVSVSDFMSLPISLPPLRTQQRIAEIIDSIDEQIQISLRLIAKYQSVRTASVHSALAAGLDRFEGREAYELHREEPQEVGSWSLEPLGNMLLGIDAGHSPDLEDTPASPGQWGVLKVSAVGPDGFHPEENKAVHSRSLYDSSICVHEGDLLMTRANTSQLVGRSCIVGSTPPGLMLCDKTLRLRVDERAIPISYVHIVLGLPEVRRQIEIAATGTSGSMKNISQNSIKQLMIPLGHQVAVQRIIEIDTLHEAEIAALGAEVDRLRLVKQGLMDDLLSGRVRVNPKVN